MNRQLIQLLTIIVFTPLYSIAQLNTDSLKMKETFAELDMYYTPSSHEAEDYYLTGYSYFAKNEFRKSIDAYIKAIKADSLFIDAMDNLGNSYRYIGNLDSAEYWFKKSIKLYPTGFIAHQNLAIVYMSKTRYVDALSEYDQLIALDSGNAEGYFGKASANILLQKGDQVVLNAEKAMKIYEKKKDPYLMDAVYFVGIGYYMQGDNKSAKKYLNKAQKMGKEIPAGLKGILH